MRLLKRLAERLFIFIGIEFKFLPYTAKFSIKNKKFWKSYRGNSTVNTNSIILAEGTHNIYLTLGISILANLVAKIKRAKVVYLLPNTTDYKYLEYIFQSFSNCSYEYVELLEEEKKQIDIIADELLKEIKTPEELLNLHYNGILLGDCVYDSAMRILPWQASVWKIDARIKKTLINFIAHEKILSNIYKKYDVKAICFSHTIGVSAFVLRYFLSKEIESYSGIVGVGPLKKHTKLKGKKVEYTGSISMAFLDTLYKDNTLKNNVLLKADEYIEQRNKGILRDLDSPRAFDSTKQTYTSKKNFAKEFNLSPDKKNVFVMLHAFNDYPHHFETNIFVDYYKWFIETLKIAKLNNHVNWIFKEHPSSVHYPDDSNLPGIFDLVENDNILFLDSESSFNSASMINLADFIITCIGTAGLEFALYSIPTIITGDNYYSDLELALQVNSFDDYKNLLMNIQNGIPFNPTKEKLEKAKIFFYLVLNIINEGTYSNNKAFLGSSTIEDRLNSNIEKLMNIYLNELDKNETTNYMKLFEKFALSKDSNMFFSDPLLAEIEANKLKIM